MQGPGFNPQHYKNTVKALFEKEHLKDILLEKMKVVSQLKTLLSMKSVLLMCYFL